MYSHELKPNLIMSWSREKVKNNDITVWRYCHFLRQKIGKKAHKSCIHVSDHWLNTEMDIVENSYYMHQKEDNFQFINFPYPFFQFIVSCWLYPLVVHISTICWFQIYDIWPVKTMRWCKLSWQESQHKFIQNWLTDLNTGVPGGHMNGWFCTLFPTYCASGRTGKAGNGNGSRKLQQLNYCTGRFEMTWSSSPEATPPSISHLLHFSP